MNLQFINDRDISYLDKMLKPNGDLVPVPYKELEKIPRNDMLLFMHYNALYTYPTEELINFLHDSLDLIPQGRAAIEICAGADGIGRLLNIPMTDSYLQANEDVAAFYRITGQVPIVYPTDVRKVSALIAVQIYNPHTVIASWATGLPGQHSYKEKSEGNSFGVDEVEMMKYISQYIMIGNTKIHADKMIFNTYPTDVIQAPWIFSRSSAPDLNRIWIVNNPKPIKHEAKSGNTRISGTSESI